MGENNITKLVMDIGNSHIKLLVGEMSSDFSKMKVLQYVEVPTNAIKKSVVESSEELSDSIRKVLGKIEPPEYRNITDVTIGVGGKYIQSKTKKVCIEFPNKVIEKEEIEELYQLAERSLSLEDRVLKREIYNIRLSDTGIVKDPIGLQGDGLEANVHLIYINQEDIEKLLDAITDVGLDIENIYLNAYASLKSTLIDENYTKMGVALIDIGEGSTDIIISKNDKIIYSQSENIGGMHFVTDIMYLFHIGEEEAREVFQAYVKGEMPDDYTAKNGKRFMKADVEKIIDARIGDIASFISDTIQDSGFTGYLGQGIVLTGGVASLERLVGKINAKTGGMVRRKKPFPIRGLEEPEYKMATVIGLFLQAMEEQMLAQQEENVEEEILVEDEAEDLTELLEEKEEQKKPSETMTIFKKWISYFV